jgi:DNA replication protein DnaC
MQQQTQSHLQASPTNSDWRPTLDEHHESLKRAANACARFVADMAKGATPYWLTLAGIHGSGKTMLASQVFQAGRQYNPGEYKNNPIWVTGSGVHDPHQRRPNCVWLHSAKFADRMRGGEYDLPEYLRADYLVVMDDLGAARDKTEFVVDALYRLADLRMHRWTIWTTNLSAKEINERMDPRISSRLIRDENKFVTITAGDYAMRKVRAA